MSGNAPERNEDEEKEVKVLDKKDIEILKTYVCGLSVTVLTVPGKRTLLYDAERY